MVLGFSTEKANAFSLKATELINISTDKRIILRDKVKNTEFDLTDGSAYEFNSEVVNDANRFSLIFRAPGVTTGAINPENEHVSVFVNAQNEIVINANAGSKYGIYNAVGQQVDNGTINCKLSTINCKLNTGVYVVKVGNTSNRIIIK